MILKKMHFLIFLLIPLVNYSQPFWSQVQKPDSLLPSAVAVDRNGDIYVTSFLHYNKGGVYFSNNDGQTGEFIGPEFQNFKTIEISNDNKILVGGNGIFVWDSITRSWQQTLSHRDVYSIKSISDSIYLAGANNSIYRSNDGGYSWIRVHYNADSTLFLENFSSINHSTFDNLVYVTTQTLYGGCGRVYRSIDLGLSFQLIESWTSTMPCSYLTSSAIDSSGKLLVGGTGLYRYTPEYDSWEILGLNNTPADILITPEEKFFFGCDHIVGSPGGAYISEDNCQTFTEINDGLNSTSVRDLAIDQYGRLLAVNGFYLQRSYEPVTTSVKEEIIQNDLKVYPNPFNQCINLVIDDTNNAGDHFIRIIDSFGNIVYQGKIRTNHFRWCPENISKGFYHLIITNESKVSSALLIYN